MQNYPITNYRHEIEMASINKYVYFKQNFLPDQPSKVLVNPHFNKKVFINPNYVPVSSSKIHINPNMALNNKKIHVNPRILQKIEPKQNVVTYSSKTKLIRTPVKQKTIQESKRIRRTSVHSNFKIVKSSNEIKSKLLFNTKYKLRRETANKSIIARNPIKLRSKFKLDNTRNTKYVFVNRFLSISDIAKKVPLRTKSLNLLNISGNIYKNSPNQLLKLRKKEKRKSVVPVNKTKYKLVRKKSLSGDKVNKKVKLSREKLKKCNIPCPYYRKFGKCKGKEQGKCPRKHDSDQIALCTKFLQGACIDSKCLLSHNVSAEKMPTCKFYLEGSCSKDKCPYLHVRINPKADVCRDFLEGFCKKASECDKRHQFLCPDFEKKGDCLKSRCPYPHGRMVRKYSDYNKHKFAKKSSTNTAKLVNNDKIEEIEAAIRYYSDKNVVDEVDANQKIDFRLRPKLGELPSFISLEDI